MPKGQVVGAAALSQQAGGVQIVVKVRDLPPGRHGFHVHETGRCDPPDFTSAGGHFIQKVGSMERRTPTSPMPATCRTLDIGRDGYGQPYPYQRLDNAGCGRQLPA